MAKSNLKVRVFRILSNNKGYVLANTNKAVYNNWLVSIFGSENPDTVKRHVSEYRSRLREDFMGISDDKDNLFTPKKDVGDYIKFLEKELHTPQLEYLATRILSAFRYV